VNIKSTSKQRIHSRFWEKKIADSRSLKIVQPEGKKKKKKTKKQFQ